MSKDSSTVECIKELISYGYTNKEISDTLKLSVNSGYIRRLRREIAKASQNDGTSIEESQERPKLTPERYYNAMKKHNGTKDNLAALLGISRMTLYNFERDSEMKKRLARYMRVRGMSLKAIASQLGTKISILKEMEIDRLPTLDSIKDQINIALEPLADVAQWDNEAETLYYLWKKASERIK